MIKNSSIGVSMKGKKTLVITNSQVQRHVTIKDAIETVESTWRWHGEGQVVMPSKITTDMSVLGVPGWFNSMPSFISPLNMAGIKLVGGYSENPKKGLPYIRSNVMLTDPHSGFLYALINGDWISDARTGAQPAVAMKYLASKSDVVTIIGAGRQAYYALSCISEIHPLKEVRVCDIHQKAREEFSSRFPGVSFKIIPYESTREACKGADVIITLTTANAVLVEESWCDEGCLVLTMGSFQEVSDDIARKFNKIYLDHIDQGLHRGQFKEMAARGEIRREDFDAELPEVVANLKTGRDNPGQRIMAQLVGMGSLDLAIAALAYKRVVQSGESCVTVDLS